MFTYEHKGKQYIGVFSGIGGWAGIGMAAGLEKDTDGLGAVGGYKELEPVHRPRWFADRLRAAELRPVQ